MHMSYLACYCGDIIHIPGDIYMLIHPDQWLILEPIKHIMARPFYNRLISAVSYLAYYCGWHTWRYISIYMLIYPDQWLVLESIKHIMARPF
jgi:hypothetical protein